MTRIGKKNSIKVGAHDNEDLPHYHLMIKSARGRIVEIPETFLHSNLDRKISAVTIADLKNIVEDRELNLDKSGTPQPFTLFWKGKKLEDTNVKLRKIVVEGTKIHPYHQNLDNPIVVILNADIGEQVESHDYDSMDPDTPRRAGGKTKRLRNKSYKRKSYKHNRI